MNPSGGKCPGSGFIEPGAGTKGRRQRLQDMVARDQIGAVNKGEGHSARRLLASYISASCDPSLFFFEGVDCAARPRPSVVTGSHGTIVLNRRTMLGGHQRTYDGPVGCGMVG